MDDCDQRQLASAYVLLQKVVGHLPRHFPQHGVPRVLINICLKEVRLMCWCPHPGDEERTIGYLYVGEIYPSFPNLLGRRDACIKRRDMICLPANIMLLVCSQLSPCDILMQCPDVSKLRDVRDSDSLKAILSPQNYSPLPLHRCEDALKLGANKAADVKGDLMMQLRVATAADEALASKAPKALKLEACKAAEVKDDLMVQIQVATAADQAAANEAAEDLLKEIEGESRKEPVKKKKRKPKRQGKTQGPSLEEALQRPPTIECGEMGLAPENLSNDLLDNTPDELQGLVDNAEADLQVELHVPLDAGAQIALVDQRSTRLIAIQNDSHAKLTLDKLAKYVHVCGTSLAVAIAQNSLLDLRSQWTDLSDSMWVALKENGSILTAWQSDTRCGIKLDRSAPRIRLTGFTGEVRAAEAALLRLRRSLSAVAEPTADAATPCLLDCCPESQKTDAEDEPHQLGENTSVVREPSPVAEKELCYHEPLGEAKGMVVAHSPLSSTMVANLVRGEPLAQTLCPSSNYRHSNTTLDDKLRRLKALIDATRLCLTSSLEPDEGSLHKRLVGGLGAKRRPH